MLDALHAIVLLYQARALDALRGYYAACRALRGTDVLHDAAALRVSADWDDAAGRLRTAWAQSRDDAAIARHLADLDDARPWLAEVACDVRLRLAGNMGRALPDPSRGVSPMAASVRPEARS